MKKRFDLCNPMKTPFNFSMRVACDSFGRMVCAGAVMLIASSAQAQNLFVADSNGTINEFTPGGVRSTFASTFDSVGGALPGVSRLPGTRTFDKVDAGDGIGRAPRPPPPQAGRKVISIHRKSPRGMCSLSRIVRSRRVRRCVRR